jgi:hypothetical protein
MALHLVRFRLPLAGLALALMFTASPGTAVAAVPGVTGFTLINADTDQPIAGFNPIQPGATLDLASLPTRRLNVRVNTAAAVGSVRVTVNGGGARVENGQPYSMTGDEAGDYRAWTPAVGSYTVTATAFAQRRAQGPANPPVSLTFRVVNTGSVPTTVPPPPDTDDPSPSTCGPMPATAPAGWQRVVSDTFSENIPLGQWGRDGGAWEQPGGHWRARPDGWKDSSRRGTYSSPKTTSQHDSLMDIWVHSEGVTRYVAAPISLVGDTLGQRISICMRADVIPGYKLAFLLWPSQGSGNERGEIDFPEGKLNGGSATARAFMHYDPRPSSGREQDAYDTGVALQGWHTYTVAWRPQSGTTEFFVDGRLFGRSTQYVPRGPMHYIMQVETYMAGQVLPPPASGHVLVDWVTIEVPRP